MDANRKVVLEVEIRPSPNNASVLAKMEAEVESSKRKMSKPATIGVAGDPTAKTSDWHLADMHNRMKPGGDLAVPRSGPATVAGRSVAGSGSASAGIGGARLLGGALVAGYAATQFIGEMASDRPNGSYINSGVQKLANIGNYFAAYYGGDANYFDPLGTKRGQKLDQRQEAMERARRDSDIYASRNRITGEINRESDLYLANRNADAGNFSELTNIDRSLYDNQRQQRLANLYGGNQEGLARAQLDLIGNRSSVTRAPELARVQNTIDSLDGVTKKSAEEERRLTDALEQQRRIKMEIAQETIKSLEATKREREERAQMIREQGMSQQERFGNLDDFQQQEIIDANSRLQAGEATVEDRRLLSDFGGEETRNRLRQQAIANAGAFPFAGEFARDANRQENIAKEIEVKLKEQKEVEINLSFERDPDGEELVRRIVEAVEAARVKRIEDVNKKAQVQLNARG